MSKFVVVVNNGPEYTPKGEKVDIILQKGFAWTLTWQDYNNGRDVIKPDVISDVAWKELFDELYTNQNRVKTLKALLEQGVDVLNCDEATIRDALLRIIQTSKITKKSSIDKMMSSARLALKAIGREHSWTDGAKLDLLGRPFLDSRNPCTKSNTKILIDNVIARHSNAKTESSLGAPVSLGVVYFTVIYLIRYSLVMIDKGLKQVSRIVNTCMLGLLLAFLMHEACRPSEIHKQLRHRDLYFIASTKIYWLTLVFLSPKTLSWVMKHNVFDQYICQFFKGKRVQDRVLRKKTSVPCLYNSIDLPTLYIVFMKIILSCDPTLLTAKVFKQMNYADLLSERNKTMGIAKFVFYSIRYAAAEEDKKYKINGSWTRDRMGHSIKSNEKDEYADNKDDRTEYNGDKCYLGCDLREDINASEILLEFCSMQGSVSFFDDKWFEDRVPDAAMRAEITEINQLVRRFCEESCDESREALIERLTPIQTTTIPVGFGNFNFPRGTFPQELSDSYSDLIADLTTRFAVFEKPAQFKQPEIWSYTQVMYGNWRGLLGGAKRTLVDPVVPVAKKPTKPASIEWDLIPENIQKNNYVVIVCGQTDKFSIELPGVSGAYVWIAKAVSFDKKRYTLKANFFKGSFDHLEYVRKVQTVQILDFDVLDIYVVDDGEEFELTSDNIASIIAMYHKRGEFVSTITTSSESP